MSLGGGDQLARGAKSVTFNSGGSGMSQMEWDAIWLKDAEFQRLYGLTKAEFREKTNYRKLD